MSFTDDEREDTSCTTGEHVEQPPINQNDGIPVAGPSHQTEDAATIVEDAVEDDAKSGEAV